MTTEARIHANRLNAEKSTGPRTPEGKARVAQNAVRHGILCDQAVLPTEDRAEFEEFRDALLGDLAPLHGLEQVLAERIVAGSWRLRRVLHHETCLLDRDAGRSLYHEHKMGLVDVRQEGDRVHPAAMGEALAESLGARHSAYDTLRRYERAIQRDLEVCLRDLERLQNHRGDRQDARRWTAKHCGLRIADFGLKKDEDPAASGDAAAAPESPAPPESATAAPGPSGNPQCEIRPPWRGGPQGDRNPQSLPPVGFVSQESPSAPAATPEAAAASEVPSPNPQCDIRPPWRGGPQGDRNPQSLLPVGFVSQEGAPALPEASPGQAWRGRGPRSPGDHVDEHGVLRDVTGRRIEREEPPAEVEDGAADDLEEAPGEAAAEEAADAEVEMPAEVETPEEEERNTQ